MAITAKKSKKKTKEVKKVDTVKSTKKTRPESIKNSKGDQETQEELKKMGIDTETLAPEVQEALKETPVWYLELFSYLYLFDELDIDVTKEPTDSTNPKDTRFKAKYLERQLFLIFECLPKRRGGSVLKQKEFCKWAGITEAACCLWKKEEWFWGNRLRMMKRIFSLHTPDVIDALYKGATTSSWINGQYDAKCIKLWLEYVEGFVSGIDLTSKGEGITIQFASGPSKFIEDPNQEKSKTPQKNDVDFEDL